MFRDRSFYTALFFCAGLTLFEEILFNSPLLAFFADARDRGLVAKASVHVVTDFLFLFFFFKQSLQARFFLKIVYLCLFALATITQFSYHQFLGRFISDVDFILVKSANLSLWISTFWFSFSWYGLIPVIVYAFILFSLRWTKYAYDGLAFVAILLAFLLLCLRGEVIPKNAEIGFDGGFSRPIVRFYESWFRYSFDLSVKERSPVPILAAEGPSIKNIVLLIDESIRADHLSLNGYHRETTPYLKELERAGFLKNMGKAIAASACSPLSNAMIITGLKPSNDALQLASQRPTVFQFAKALGYQTTYVDAQTDTLWTGLTAADLQYVDRWIKSSELGESISRDFSVAKIANEILSDKNSQHLLVVNKQGVHYMYEDSYPPEATIWGPLPPDRNYLKYKELVTNPYDNGIRYAVDEFFRRLVRPDAIPQDTIYIYTSDHSQTLFEEGASWLHCNHLFIEAEVPLFIVGPPQILRGINVAPRHDSILPTILSLMGLSDEQLKNAGLPVSQATAPHKQCFVSGALRTICRTLGASNQ